MLYTIKNQNNERVFFCFTYSFDQPAGIYYIINISFGTTVDAEEIHAAIKRAYNAGILIIAAAGNNGVVEYPAAYDEVVAVGAVDAKGERAEGSAIGDELELVAPGQQIVSTGAFGGVCVVGGTSLAAPHVTEVASVL